MSDGEHMGKRDPTAWATIASVLTLILGGAGTAFGFVGYLGHSEPAKAAMILLWAAGIACAIAAAALRRRLRRGHGSKE